MAVVEGKSGCTAVAVKQKVNLYTDDYFGAGYGDKVAKTDKFEVTPKGCGTFSKGIFTGKKAETVTVTRLAKDGKNYLPVDSVSFTVEAPDYLKTDTSGKKPKAIKQVTSIKKGDEFDMSEYIGCPSVEPEFYEISDKKGNFTLNDPREGVVTVNASGSCKVTAYYCEEIEDLSDTAKVNAAKKNAAKIQFTIKSTIPTMKDAKVAAGKKITVAVTKVSKAIQLTADDWSIVEVNAEGEPEFDSPSKAFTKSPVEKKKYMSCEVTATSDAATGTKAALVCTIDEVEYWSIITVK